MDNRRVVTSQDVLYYSAGIGLFLYTIFSVRGRAKEPTRLNLRAQTGTPSSRVEAPEPLAAETPLENTRSLNVIFNYNGHNFDAFEVLGLPAGARAAQVEAAYLKAKGSAGTEGARDFIETAYLALRPPNAERARGKAQ